MAHHSTSMRFLHINPVTQNPPETTMAHATFHWDDPFLLDQQLSDDERMVRDAAAAYCHDKLAPRVLEAFRYERMDTTIFREMGEVGLLGPTIPEQYGDMPSRNTRYAFRRVLRPDQTNKTRELP